MPAPPRYDDALDRIASIGRIRRVERVPLGAARGRVLAVDLVAREELPGFDNSAMDGFCLRSADAAGASPEHPVRLPVGGTVFAGAPLPDAEAARAGALRIMTGAPVPPAFDAVLRVEDAVVEGEGDAKRLRLDAPVPAGANVRRRGEDVRVGRRLIAAPRALTPGLLAVAAGQGVADVDVVARPSLRIVATGDELVDDPARALRPGQIRNTSLPFLLAEAERLGLPARSEGLVPDREDEVLGRVKAWVGARRGLRLDDPRDPAAPEIVVSTGAVSVGEKDFVPSLLRRLGFEVLVHGVAVRPGKPVLVAHRAAGAIVWAGLPGNVLSTAASFRFFVLPLVRSLLGLDPHPHALRARLARDFPKPAGLRFFARCSLRTAPDGALEAHPDDRQASGMVSALAATDAYAVFAEELSLVPAGAMVDVVPDGEEL